VLRAPSGEPGSWLRFSHRFLLQPPRYPKTSPAHPPPWYLEPLTVPPSTVAVPSGGAGRAHGEGEAGPRADQGAQRHASRRRGSLRAARGAACPLFRPCLPCSPPPQPLRAARCPLMPPSSLTRLRRPHALHSDAKVGNRNVRVFGWERSSRGRFATPADYPRHDGTSYRGLHVHRECLGFVHRSRDSPFSVAPCQTYAVTIRNVCICTRSSASPCVSLTISPSPASPPRRSTTRRPSRICSETPRPCARERRRRRWRPCGGSGRRIPRCVCVCRVGSIQRRWRPCGGSGRRTPRCVCVCRVAPSNGGIYSDAKVANRNVKGFGTGRQKLDEGQIPNCRVVRVALRVASGTGYTPGERNPQASQNGRVSDPHPKPLTLRFATFALLYGAHAAPAHIQPLGLVPTQLAPENTTLGVCWSPHTAGPSSH
jgi:hypothetical protein